MKWVKDCYKNDSCTIFLVGSHEEDGKILETDPVLSRNYSLAFMKMLMIKSCTILIMQSKFQIITALL